MEPERRLLVSQEERARGLMYRRFMPQDRGMLFDFKREEQVAMWMKNTILPLDMLFVDARGCVVTIKQNAKPGSLATIGSRVPVQLVVELKAGTVAAQNIALGDRVLRLDAGWPADAAACTAPR